MAKVILLNTDSLAPLWNWADLLTVLREKHPNIKNEGVDATALQVFIQ